MSQDRAARDLTITLDRALRRLRCTHRSPAEQVLATSAQLLLKLGAGGPSQCALATLPGSQRRGDGLTALQALAQSFDTERQLRAEIARLERLAGEDPLTALANRRTFDARLAARLATPASPTGCTLLLLDLDDFKSINDGHSHQVGDRVLVTVATLLTCCVREVDLVARLGGDEFAIVLQDSDADRGMQVADRITVSMQAHDWSRISAGLAPRLSIGLAHVRQEDTVESLLDRADASMYGAKRGAHA